MKQKTRKTVIVLLAAAAVIATAFALTAKPLFNIDLSLIRTKTNSSSVATLSQVRDILRLNTVEVVHKAVFPFDFVPPELDWEILLARREKGAVLTVGQRDYLSVFDLCLEIGIDLRRNRNEFVVITATVKAGFDLADPVFSSAQPLVEYADEYISIDDENTVFIKLPAPKITEFILEDADAESYPYPDIGLDPAEWKKLTTFVKNQVQEEAISLGVLDIAEKNGKDFIEKLLLDLGYSAVSFRK